MVVIAQALVEYGLLAALTTSAQQRWNQVVQLTSQWDQGTWAAVGGAALLALVLWSRRSSRF
jgi:hypothetical protein